MIIHPTQVLEAPVTTTTRKPTRHFQGLRGAEVIPTTYFQLTARTVRDVVRRLSLGVVHGPAALGKTFAVWEATRDLVDVPVYWVEFLAKPSVPQLAADLLLALTEVEHDEESRKLGRILLDELSREPCLVVIDEAQDLSAECCEYLRRLHDRYETQFGILLVGGDKAWHHLSRFNHLRSRTVRRVCFQPLTADEVLETLPNYHPIYEGVEPELLLLVDDNYAHGKFRDWAAFTADAVDICDEADTEQLTEEVALNVFALRGGVSDEG